MMRGRLLFLAGLGLGYVLGTRRGRGGFVELKNRAKSLWQSTPVQEAVSTVTSIAEEKAPKLSAKIATVADKAAEKAAHKAKPTAPDEATAPEKPTVPDGPSSDG